MKLYSTVTSERASKGQGGNKYIKIEIMDENKEVFLSLMINKFPDGINCSYAIDEYKAYLEKDTQETLKITTKGKKQKTVSHIKKQLKDDREKDNFNSGMQ